MANRIAIAVLLVVGACSYQTPEGSDATSTPPVVAFEFSSSGADEGALGATSSTVQVPVVLSKPAETRITVQCSALPGSTASEVNDFVINTHTITFEIGDLRKDVEVEIFKDAEESEGESFQLALSDPVGATLNAEKAIHTVAISDVILPRISFLSPATTTGEATQTQLAIVLDQPSDGQSTVVIGVTPGETAPMDSEDIALAEGQVVTIPSGAKTVMVDIGENPDALDELATENVTFELKGASQNLVIDITKKLATHAITDDDDPPIVDFQATTSNFDESAGTVTVTVRLSGESGLPVTVSYNRQAGDTADDADATVNGSAVTFNPRTPGVPGETTKTFTVVIADDTIDENAETVIVSLVADPTNGTLQGNVVHTLTINEDTTDPPSVVSWDVTSSSRTEGNNTHSIQVNIDPPSGKSITVPFSIAPQSSAEEAGSGSGSNDYDFNTTSPFTISPGSATFTFRIDVNGDTDNENNETVLIDLENPTNGTLGTNQRHTFTINDND